MSEIERIANEMTRGNTNAAEWFLSLVRISNVVDKIADSQEIDVAEAEAAFLRVLVGWGVNPFFREHGPILSAVALNAFAAWKSSDTNPELRAKAFDVATEVGTTVAWLIGGIGHSLRWSTELRRWALARQLSNDMPEAESNSRLN